MPILLAKVVNDCYTNYLKLHCRTLRAYYRHYVPILLAIKVIQRGNYKNKVIKTGKGDAIQFNTKSSNRAEIRRSDATVQQT